jgi:hypothetical protein
MGSRLGESLGQSFEGKEAKKEKKKNPQCMLALRIAYIWGRPWISNQ